MILSELNERLERTPIIAAVKSDDELKQALACQALVSFVLYGNLLNIAGIVEQLKKAGKAAFVHVDLVEGLAPREVAIDFIASSTKADGIISTKPTLIRCAKDRGLMTIQRFFLLDSLALKNVQKQTGGDSVDMIEVLPGVMPKVISKIASQARKPIIAGGLISDKEDVVAALGAGAVAVSTTDPVVWFM